MIVGLSLAVGIPTVAIGSLFLHRAGVANTLRRIGLAFYAAGDAVTHCGARYRHMVEELIGKEKH